MPGLNLTHVSTRGHWMFAAIRGSAGVMSSYSVATHNRIHYNDVIMSAIASQITSLTVVYSTVYSGADQRKHESSASLALVRGIHRGPVNSPHKWPVTRKMFPFDDVIMPFTIERQAQLLNAKTYMIVPHRNRIELQWLLMYIRDENGKIFPKCTSHAQDSWRRKSPTHRNLRHIPMAQRKTEVSPIR